MTKQFTITRPLDAAAAIIELHYFKPQYSRLSDLITALTLDVQRALEAVGYTAEYGASNISCSTYLSVGDHRLRFSDHRNVRSGECHTIRVDTAAYDIWSGFDAEAEDIVYSDDRDTLDDAEYAGSAIDESDYCALIAEALEVIHAAS